MNILLVYLRYEGDIYMDSYEQDHLGLSYIASVLRDNGYTVTLINAHFLGLSWEELKEKIELLDSGITWHFIGHLQTNKVKYIADKVDLIHSVDSIKLLKEINKRAAQKDRVINVLIQVNVANDEAKFGIETSDLEDFIKEASEMTNIKVQGLMTIVPFEIEKENLRPYFKKMNEIFDNMKNLKIDNVNMKYLSMGMTNDYDIAIEEGSNMVRIGTGIFGERIYKK